MRRCARTAWRWSARYCLVLLPHGTAADGAARSEPAWHRLPATLHRLPQLQDCPPACLPTRLPACLLPSCPPACPALSCSTCRTCWRRTGGGA
jgi:hypothetical protein